MDLGITGKVAVVTGGSHGMGRAVAEELGRNGCRVVVVARGQQRLDETVEAITREGGQAVAVSADIPRLESFPLIVEQAKAALDRKSVVVGQSGSVSVETGGRGIDRK